MTKFIHKIISKYQCEFKKGKKKPTSNGKKKKNNNNDILLLYAALLTFKLFRLHFNS